MQGEPLFDYVGVTLRGPIVSNRPLPELQHDEEDLAFDLELFDGDAGYDQLR
jgi:hypothetical protein